MSDSTRPESLLCKVALRFCLKYFIARANTLIAGSTWCLSSSIVVYLDRSCHIRIKQYFLSMRDRLCLCFPFICRDTCTFFFRLT